MSAGRNDQSGLWAQVGLVSGLGFVLFGAIGGGYLLGWLLDGWLGTGPIMAMVGAGLGLAGGLIKILQILKRVEKSGGAGGNRSSGD